MVEVGYLMSILTSASARIVANRYALFDEIGVGGMATVHIGRLRGAAGFMRTVAIKRLHPALIHDPDFVSMLIDEARLAARIRHPNVVQTLDVVLEGRELFVVMEYIQGESVSHLMGLAQAQLIPIPCGIAVTIIADVLRGLHAAHETKDENGASLELVHRDVSPQNILVGTDGLSRVLDFGIAKSAGSLHISQIGRVKGKFSYIAPEQIADANVGRQADIYSASVILWELLTGRRLFRGDSQEATLAQVLAGNVTAPSMLVSGLPRGLDVVVLRGLARKPANRFPTAAAMALALERCCELESHTEIAAWLEQLAQERLQVRADCVARMERTFNASEVSELRDLLGKITELGPDSTDGEVSPSQPMRGGQESKYSLTVAVPAVERRLMKRRRLIIAIGAAVVTVGAALLLLSLDRTATRASRGDSLSAAQTHTLVAPQPSVAPAPDPAAAASETPPSPATQASEESTVISLDEGKAPSSQPQTARASTRGRKASTSSQSPKSSRQESPFSHLGGRQ
jgi:serine/threonine protein kinase